MTTPVQRAIEQGEVGDLRARLDADPALANTIIRWGPNGKNPSVPLHYVCDMVFNGVVDAAAALPLAEALLASGAAIDTPHEYHGDTPLIGAASLLVEDVGLRLVEAGADVTARGLFGATALHWASMHGLTRLAEALIEAGADIQLPDTEHDGSPFGWAVHGWKENKKGVPRTQPDVARLLVAAGAPVSDELRDFLDPEADAPFLRAIAQA
jgi:ankyrin repeat protein